MCCFINSINNFKQNRKIIKTQSNKQIATQSSNLNRIQTQIIYYSPFKKSGAMNIQTYQNCISTLQNQIKSREQQRQSMQNTIMALDRDLGIEIERNRKMRDELMYLAQTNQNIIDELRKLEQVVREKDAVIDERLAADQGRRLYIEALERAEVGLEEDMGQRDRVIANKDVEIGNKDNQLNIALQSIKGYEYRLQLKAKELTQFSSKLHHYEGECAQLNQKLVNLKNQHQSQREQLVEKLLKCQGSASSIVSELQLEIKQLQKQLEQAKQFYTDQVSTLQFNKQSQANQLNKRISSLSGKITSLEQQVAYFKQQQKKLKSHYQVQIQNNDKVVNTLINEINFLKQEKVELKKRSSQKIQETVQQFIMMELEKQEREAKTKAAEGEIRTLKEELYRKEKEVVTLNKEIEKLNLQVEIGVKENQGEKDTVLRKNEEIAELKRFIENLKKFAQVADKQKQSLGKKTSKQISSLNQQNHQLSKKLQLTTQQLQQLRITSSQLQHSVKFLSLQKHSTSSNLNQLQTQVKTHEFTIEKLQNMQEQTKRVVVDLNRLMKTKLVEVETLEMSNDLFRKEKVQWIRKEEDYRRRIGEYRAVVAAGKKINLNETSFMSRARKSVGQKDTTNGNSNNGNSMSNGNKQRAQSMVVQMANEKDTVVTASSYTQSAMKRKTITVGNISEKAKTLTTYDSNNNNYIGSQQHCPANQSSTQSLLTLPLDSNAFKKPQTFKTKNKSVNFTQITLEAPVIPVLIAMKKQEEKVMNLSFQEKNEPGKEERIGWEVLSQNLIEGMEVNPIEGMEVNPIEGMKDREAQSSKEENKEESQVQRHQQVNKLPVPQAQSVSQSPIQPQTKQLPQVLQQSQKQTSTFTHASPLTFEDNYQPTTIQARSQNMTPEFHIQSQSPDSMNKSGVDKQQEQNIETNLTQGYQTLEQYEEEQRRISIPKKISPISSRVLVRQDQLGEILEDEELTQMTELNECSEEKGIQMKDQSLSNQEAPSLCNNQADDSVEAQNTVDVISILLDRINTQ